MTQNRNIKIAPRLSGWLLLFCCVVGCTCYEEKAMHGRAFPCDPAYGFRPTCWRHWPCCCPPGRGPGWTEPTVAPLSDGELVPTPPAEPSAGRPEPNDRLPPAPNEPRQPPPITDSGP